jgi:hypothetical protein
MRAAEDSAQNGRTQRWLEAAADRRRMDVSSPRRLETRRRSRVGFNLTDRRGMPLSSFETVAHVSFHGDRTCRPKCLQPLSANWRPEQVQQRGWPNLRLLDDLVGAREQHGGNGEAERPRGR